MLAAGKTNFDRAWPSHLERTIEGVRVPFLGIDALIQSKDTDRPRDIADVAELRYLQKSTPPGKT